jgi:hypothetical protein
MIGLFGSLLSKAKVLFSLLDLLYFLKKKQTNKLVFCSTQTLGPLRTPLLWMFTAILFLAALLSWLLRPSKWRDSILRCANDCFIFLFMLSLRMLFLVCIVTGGLLLWLLRHSTALSLAKVVLFKFRTRC